MQCFCKSKNHIIFGGSATFAGSARLLLYPLVVKSPFCEYRQVSEAVYLLSFLVALIEEHTLHEGRRSLTSNKLCRGSFLCKIVCFHFLEEPLPPKSSNAGGEYQQSSHLIQSSPGQSIPTQQHRLETKQTKDEGIR